MNLQERAKKVNGNRDNIMEGKQKVNINEVIASYPDGVTLRYAQVIEDHKRNTVYGVCVCDEMPDVFFFGGVGVVGLIRGLIEDFADEQAFNEELAKEGLRVKFYQKRSQYGNVYTAVEVL